MGTGMGSFSNLAQTIEQLLAPNGCPWDRKQTVETLAPMLLEETAEVLDALHEKDQQHLLDEMGDLAITFIFMCKVAQNEGRFSWDEPFVKGNEKLIRRHPHIFTNEASLSSEEVAKQWDEIKKEEVFHAKRKSCLDGIPDNLPILARFQKLCTRIKKTSPELYQHALKTLDGPCKNEDDDFERRMAQLIFEATARGTNLEVMLRGAYSKIHKEIVEQEVVASSQSVSEDRSSVC